MWSSHPEPWGRGAKWRGFWPNEANIINIVVLMSFIRS